MTEESINPACPAIWSEFLSCFMLSLSYVGERVAEGGYIPRHHDWYSLSWRENGYPSYDNHLLDGPYDYGDILGPSLGSMISGRNRPKAPSTDALRNAIRADDRAKTYFTPWSLFEVHIDLMLHQSIDRFVHLHNRYEATDAEVFELYQPLERHFVLDRLPITIAVPIVGVQFQCDFEILGNEVYVAKMPELWQAARTPSSYSYGHHPLVQASATHALVLTNFEIPNRSYIESLNAATDSAEVLTLVDKAFAAIRISSKVQIGYAQVLSIPVGWASRYSATRHPLSAKSLKKYPASFEAGCWAEENPVKIDQNSMKNCPNIFGGLCELSAKNNKLTLLSVDSTVATSARQKKMRSSI